MKKDNEEKSSSVLEWYAKYLDIFTFLLIGELSIATIFSLIVFNQIWFTIFVICALIMAFHSIITILIMRRELHPYRLIITEDKEYYLNIIIYIFFFSSAGLIFLTPYPWFSFLKQYTLLLSWVFVISTILFVFNTIHNFSLMFVKSSLRTKLRLTVTLQSIPYLRTQELKARQKAINKYFKWFKEALTMSNSFIGKTFPNHPEVIDIESYYTSAYMKALAGNEEELDKLKENIVELMDSIEDKEIRRYLISLYRLKGKTFDEHTTLEELSNLIRLKSRFSRFSNFVKNTQKIILTIMAAIVGAIVKYLLDLIQIALQS